MKEKKEKERKKLLGSNIFGFRRRTRSQQSDRRYIAEYSNHINIYQQKYMKTILIQKKGLCQMEAYN